MTLLQTAAEKERALKSGCIPAYIRQQDIIHRSLDQLEQDSRHRSMRILDYGTGSRSLSRNILEHHIGAPGHHDLTLFEPIDPITPSQFANVHTVSDDPLDQLTGMPFDLINISYTLNQLSWDEMQRLMDNIRGHSPQALVTIFDYTLDNITREQALGFLTCKTEMDCRAAEGDDAFLKRRTRFSIRTLTRWLRSQQMSVLSSCPLSSKALRTGITARPNLASMIAF